MSEMSPAEEVFFAALERPTPAERAAYLDAVCASQPELRARVEKLLAAYPKAGGFLEPEAFGATDTFDPDAPPAGAAPTADFPGKDERIGSVIAGKYKLVEEIGEGGMGSVYMAQQTEPVKRAVAVKVIRAGMDSKAVLARFEAERQALSMMDHPNIARVLDAGTTESGRPFFVMELVKGVPITQYCDERKLTPRQRLELFIPVCNAIQHAHQKGVIHRDIKPSNVLVALYDDRPVPKVIDFGVAKATGQSLTDKTLMTGFGAVVGTPEYMSPEQANLNNLDIDTRSDVYALGVLLYELLTGSTPVDRKSLGKAALLEILRIVREVEAPRPSTKLSAVDTLPSIAANRGTEPARLSKLMKGELDWILLKALEKDRTRRYESANGLARDVQRYLADEVVEARPPSSAYRVRKFVRRHKGRVTATAAFLALLFASAVVSSWLAVKAKRAEATAEERRIEAEENAGRAEANAKEAERNAEALGKESNERMIAVTVAEIRSLGLKVDLDLAEVRTDPRVGLLRLARPLNHTYGPLHQYLPNSQATVVGSFEKNPSFIELREFVTAAVLTTGQNYASLLPPITHDGHAVDRLEVSPDSRTLLTYGADGTARLWDMRTAKPIAILRQGSERVVNGGFSTDGRTVFTDDETGVARFWEPADGKYRAQIERRLNLYTEAVDRVISAGARQVGNHISRSVCMQIGRDRLLTQRVGGRPLPIDPGIIGQYFAGPVELWDTTTGRLVARLDGRSRDVNEFRFLRDGQWVTTVEDTSTAVILSAQDGRVIARLVHPAGEVVQHLDVSPNGRRVATITHAPIRGGNFSKSIRMWDTESWQADTTTMSLNKHATNSYPGNFQLRDHDVFGLVGDFLFYDGAQVFYRFGKDEPLAMPNRASPPDPNTGDRVFLDGGRVCDARTWQQLRPPAGQRHHPDLARFALDGRFVSSQDPHTAADILIDTRTQKQFSNSLGSVPMRHSPGIGLVTAANHFGAVIQLIPTGFPDLPPKVLELWVQVAVRGELGPDGEFVKWDEPTWEKKRQELAAIPAPNPDLPFPGYVATDKLHWLRAEYEAATDADKLRLANELLRRAEAAGDKNEAVRWRAEKNRLSPDIAPPREKK